MTLSNFIAAPNRKIAIDGTEFAYRDVGPRTGVPIVMLNHLAATLDNFDPRIVDGLAAEHRVVLFDNRGVGASGGTTPRDIGSMARDAVAFIRAMGFEQVDLLGFSMGGFIAQQVVLDQPKLIRRLILTGTGPAGGVGMDKVTGITIISMIKAALTFQDPKVFLFFTRTANGRRAAREFIARLKERKVDRDKPIALSSFGRQLTAIKRWALQAPQDLSVITQPTFVANGDDDLMVPTPNSRDLAHRIPGAKLAIYEDAGHGGIFQHYHTFVPAVLEFLR